MTISALPLTKKGNKTSKLDNTLIIINKKKKKTSNKLSSRPQPALHPINHIPRTVGGYAEPRTPEPEPPAGEEYAESVYGEWVCG